jgi:Putative prokaryotic signal transducing protein
MAPALYWVATMTRRGRVIPFPTKPAPPDERALTEVHRCNQAEAIVVKGLFESEGIPTVLRSRIAHSVHPFTVGAQGEVMILVPAADAARSRRLLARHASA